MRPRIHQSPSLTVLVDSVGVPLSRPLSHLLRLPGARFSACSGNAFCGLCSRGGHGKQGVNHG